MKKITLLLSGVLFCTLAFANGTDEPTAASSVAVTRAKGSQQFKLFYKASRPGKVEVAISNDTGKKIFTETIYDTDGFIRPYNFSELPYGEYEISIVDETGKQVQSVKHSQDRIEKLIHVMKMEEDGKYMLTVASRGSDSVGVRILDENNQILHDKNYEVNGEFAQIFNMKVKNFKIEVTDASGVLKTLTY
jgi:hypothetical protein